MLITAPKSPAGDVQDLPRLTYGGTLKVRRSVRALDGAGLCFATQLYFAGTSLERGPRLDPATLVFLGSPHARSVLARPAARRSHDAAGTRGLARAARRRLDHGGDSPPVGRAPAARIGLSDDFADYFLDRFYSDLLIYAVIAGVSFSRQYADQVKRAARQAHELALRTADLERRLVESQLQSLRAQLQPHFLFNALNTISAFTETNPQMARRLMAQLGDLLRASLRHAAQPLVTLGEELTFLDDFLAIESARFEGRLHVSVRADDDLLPVMVPSFLLQPLVENAIRHGVGPRLSGGRVEITADGRAVRAHRFVCATTAWACRRSGASSVTRAWA